MVGPGCLLNWLTSVLNKAAPVVPTSPGPRSSLRGTLPPVLGVHPPFPSSLDGLHHPVQSGAIRPAHTTNSLGCGGVRPCVRPRDGGGLGAFKSGLDLQAGHTRHQCWEWGCALRPQGLGGSTGHSLGDLSQVTSTPGSLSFLICAKGLIIAPPIE